MEKLKNNKELEGIIVVDKPGGITSHDVVDAVRRRLGIRQVGHAGTLDPLATGVLIILVGKATKLFPKFSQLDKEYEAELRLGVSTTSGDKEGEVVKVQPYHHLTPSEIEEAVLSFQGQLFQKPPMMSALHHKGKRLYKLARRGKFVNLAPRRIHIYDIKVKEINIPYVKLYLRCSSGTYVRKLAEDIGERLSCGAHVVKIRRLSVGKFSLAESVSLEGLNETHIRPA